MRIRRSGAHGTPASRRSAARLPLLAYGVAMALVATTVMIWITIHRRLPGAQPFDDWLPLLSYSLTPATLGVVLTRRRPEHPIGWLFLALGCVSALQGLSGEVVATISDGSGTSTTAEVLALLHGQLGWLSWGCMAIILVLFPTGRPFSRFWRALLWIILAWFLAVSVVTTWLSPPPAGVFPGVANPFGFTAVPSALLWLDVALYTVVAPLVLVGPLLAVPARFLLAEGVERQQLKVFMYAVAVTFALFVIPPTVFPYLLLGEAADTVRWSLPPIGVAIGVTAAILRHGLYDIDRLINRTLVYTGLTAVLALLYAGAVLVAGQVFGGVADEPPAWAVAGATLVVAALFQPGRRHMQEAVDRRFNRRRYDMLKTVEAFSAHLRDEVDLGSLGADLVNVVTQTVQPVTAALWLRRTGPEARMP